MKRSTFTILDELEKTTDIHRFIADHKDEFFTEPAHVYLGRIMVEKGISGAQLSVRSGLGNYCYMILSGTRKPSRDAALRLVIGLGLDVERSQQYLRIAQLARLDPRSCRDAAILYALGKKLDLIQTQMLLAELGETEL